jgi:hypothetical protein
MTNEGAHKQGRSAIFFSSFRFFGFVIFEGSQIPLLFAFPFHCGGKKAFRSSDQGYVNPLKGGFVVSVLAVSIKTLLMGCGVK